MICALKQNFFNNALYVRNFAVQISTHKDTAKQYVNLTLTGGDLIKKDYSRGRRTVAKRRRKVVAIERTLLR